MSTDARLPWWECRAFLFAAAVFLPQQLSDHLVISELTKHDRWSLLTENTLSEHALSGVVLSWHGGRNAPMGAPASRGKSGERPALSQNGSSPNARSEKGSHSPQAVVLEGKPCVSQGHVVRGARVD